MCRSLHTRKASKSDAIVVYYMYESPHWTSTATAFGDLLGFMICYELAQWGDLMHLCGNKTLIYCKNRCFKLRNVMWCEIIYFKVRQSRKILEDLSSFFLFYFWMLSLKTDTKRSRVWFCCPRMSKHLPVWQSQTRGLPLCLGMMFQSCFAVKMLWTI